MRILSDSQAIDRRGRLIDITGLAAVRMIGKDGSWVVPLDSVDGGNEFVLLGLGGEGCDPGGPNGNGNGNGPDGGGGGEQMIAGMQISVFPGGERTLPGTQVLMFEGDTIDCCEGEYEVVIEDGCQCPEHLIEDEGVGCKCENLQDPEDYCHSDQWEYRFEIDAPCTSCVDVSYLYGAFTWACPMDCDAPDPPPGWPGNGNGPTEPTLVCDENTTRGETGGCELTGLPSGWPQSIPDGPVNHAEWTFSPHPIQPWPAGPEISDPNLLPTVDSLNDPTGEWKGTLVASGAVSVTVTVEDSTFHLGPEELTVQDRTGSFANTPYTWHGRGPDLPVDHWRLFEIAGVNADFASGSPALEDLIVGDVVTDTVGTGPNSGYGWVISTTYKHSRRWHASAAFQDSTTAEPYLIHNGQMTTQHQLVVLLADAPRWNAAVAGIESHEAYGGTGQYGHQDRFDWILDSLAVRSQRSCANVRPIVERIVGVGQQFGDELVNAREYSWRAVWAPGSHYFVFGHWQGAAAMKGGPVSPLLIDPLENLQHDDLHVSGTPSGIGDRCDWSSFGSHPVP